MPQEQALAKHMELGLGKTAWTELGWGKQLSAKLTFWGRLGWTHSKLQQHLHMLRLRCHFMFWAVFWPRSLAMSYLWQISPGRCKKHSQRSTLSGVCLLCTSRWGMAQHGRPSWGKTDDIPKSFHARGRPGPAQPIIWSYLCELFLFYELTSAAWLGSRGPQESNVMLAPFTSFEWGSPLHRAESNGPSWAFSSTH